MEWQSWIRTGAAGLVGVLLAPLGMAADWLVDGGGSGDFAEISAALADSSVVDGDRLWVLPGSYGAFATDKAVQVLAASPDGFQAMGARFFGPGPIAVRGMRTFDLELDGLLGLAVVSECEVGLPVGAPLQEPLYRGSTRIQDARQVMFLHTTLRGSGDCYPDYHAGGAKPAVEVLRSTVVLSDCELYGGNDTIDSPECNPHYGGRVGVDARDGSAVYLVASPVRGGGSPWAGTAAALHVQDSFAEVRGQGRDVLWSGHPDTAPVTGSGAVVVSGVRVGPLPLPAWVQTPEVAEPYLRCAATVAIGHPLKVQVYGPAGARYLLAAGFGPLPGSLPVLNLGPLWLDLSGPLVYAEGNTLGHESPHIFALGIPQLAALGGRDLVLQAFFPAHPSFGAAGGEALTPPEGVRIL